MRVRSALRNICCKLSGIIYCEPSQGRTERLLAQITLGPSSAAAYRRGWRVHLPKAKSRDETGRRVQFYVALGLVTAATLMLQIIETRIISVTSWYYLAFFVISIAMFGLTAGAVFVYLRTERFRPERLSYDLAVAAPASASTTDLAILVQLTSVTGASPSVTSLLAC